MFSWLRAEAQGTRIGRRRARFHPHAGEAWFRALPDRERARFNREWREAQEHECELTIRQAHGVLRAGVPQALIFVILNGFCPGDSGATYLVSLVVGLGLGMILGAVRADRVLSGMAGLFLFVALQWATRGGLSCAHLFWFVPAGALSAYLGIEREG